MPSLVSRLFTGEYLVKRTGKATYLNGNYVPGRMEEITVLGSLQPTNARELKLPEEGNRLKQYFKFYSDAPVLVMSERSLARSDRVCLNGDWFKAMSTEPWQGHVDLPYFMTILEREPEQDSDGQGAIR